MYAVYEVQTPEGVYVGVTSRSLGQRLRELRCTRGFSGTIRMVAAFKRRGDALAMERFLRPDYGIGLNRAKGGERSGGGQQRFSAANPNAKRVRVHGVEYPTIIEAAQAHGIKRTTACYRVNSAFTGWECVS